MTEEVETLEGQAFALLENISSFFNESQQNNERPYMFSNHESMRQFFELIALNHELNTAEIYKKVIFIFENNIFHSIQRKPVPRYEIDMEDDEQPMNFNTEKSSFIQMMIEMCDSSNFKIDEAKKAFTLSFCQKLISLFYSEDMSEREQLKTLLHRVYGKFINLRAKIRLMIKYTFIEVIQTKENCPGLSQILDLLSSIVNGYATPIKDEHKVFLKEALIPLIKLPNLIQFERQLKACLFIFSFKDSDCLIIIFQSILRFWSINIPNKSIIMLNWIKEFIEIMPDKFYPQVRVKLLKIFNQCIISEHTVLNELSLSYITGGSPNNLPPIMRIIAVEPKSSIQILLSNLRTIGADDWNGQMFLLQKELDRHLREHFTTQYYEAFEEMQNDPKQSECIKSWKNSIERLKNYDSEEDSNLSDEMEIEN